MKIASIVLMCLTVVACLGPMFASGSIGAGDFLLVIAFGVPAIVLSNLARGPATQD